MSDEQVAVVTGGSSGLGAIMVRHLAARGYGVVMNYRSAAKAEAVIAELAQAGLSDRVLKVAADVRRRDEVRAMFDETLAQFGRVDVLINSAGVNRDAPILELTDDMWDEVVSSHLKGAFICCQEYLFHNTDRPGHIINLGAACGFQGRTDGANFCSAKGGVLALTKSLALELAPRVQVNCLIPGSFDTPDVRERYAIHTPEGRQRVIGRIPAGRIGEPEDITHMVDAILGSRYTTGANFFVNGGNFMQ